MPVDAAISRMQAAIVFLWGSDVPAQTMRHLPAAVRRAVEHQLAIRRSHQGAPTGFKQPGLHSTSPQDQRLQPAAAGAIMSRRG